MINIHKEVYGQGKPIVLIHGWAMHTGIWRKFAQTLARQYRVICLDLPGHGLSETVVPYTLDQICDALIDVVPEASFNLLGWSLGASVALAMAYKHPQRVTSLTMLAGNPKFVENGDWSGMKAELLEDFAKNLCINCKVTLIRFLALQVNDLPEGRRLLTELKKTIQECDPPTERVLQNGLNILKDVDLRDELSRLHCPVNIIQGDRDTLIPVKASQGMHKIQPASDLNIIQGAGHVPFISHQSQVIEIINRFI